MRGSTSVLALRCAIVGIVAASAVVVACSDSVAPTQDDAPPSSVAEIGDAGAPAISHVRDAATRADADAAAVEDDPESLGFHALDCEGIDRLVGDARDVVADEPLDYIVERYENIGSDGGPYALAGPLSRGTPCATASDKAACLAKVEAADVLTGWAARYSGVRCGEPFEGDPQGGGRPCFVDYWVYTRGDEVDIAFTRAEKVSLVGRVDNVGEAAIIARNAGYSIWCGEQSYKPYGRSTATGYELLGTRYRNCIGTVTHVRISVGFDGTVTEVSHEETDASICLGA